MFCSKCHTEIRDENMQYCPRCGQKLDTTRTNNHFYFNSTFKNSQNEHKDQYEYSKEYSDVFKDKTDTHEEQYNYNKDYSNVKKNTADEHHNQYNYSKNYSDVVKDQADEHNEQYTYSYNYSKTSTEIVTSDEDYIKAYIKTNYYRIKNKKFNIGALIFGPFYCIYRKMYSLGILLLIIELLFVSSIGGDYTTVIELFINLYLAIKINEIYLKKVNTRIDNIKNNNPDKSSTELIKICSEEGGTLPVKKIVSAIILFIIILSILSTIYEFDKYIEEEITKENTTYTIKEITYTKPNNFTEVNSSELHNYIKTNDSSCYLNVYSILYPRDVEEYLSSNSNSSSYTSKSNVLSYDYNGKKWNYITMTSSYGNKDIYVHKYNNYLYVFTFEGDCKDYIYEIINTVEYNKKDE